MEKKSLLSKGEQFLMNTYDRGDKILIQGAGSYVKDIDGKTYLDFVSGIATNALGHAQSGLVKQMQQQASQLIHSANLFWNQPSIELAEKLAKLSHLDKVFFTNSGAEANEAALKLARKWSKETKGEEAYQIVTLKESFHGRTLFTLSATGQPTMHESFQPINEGFTYVALNDVATLKEVVNDNTTAIMIETLQGEGGVNPISNEFAATIQALAKEHNVLIIIDEIQTGMGRTGEMFSYFAYDLKPDIITLAKALGGGFPIGAMLAKDKVAKSFSVGDHGTTFGGNPLATSVGNYVVDTITKEKLLENVRERSQQLFTTLEKWLTEFNSVESVKGKGLLVGLKIAHPVKEVVEACYQKGLLVTSSKGNVLRILPPLNVTEEEIDEALDILRQVLTEFN